MAAGKHLRIDGLGAVVEHKVDLVRIAGLTGAISPTTRGLQ